MISIRRHRNLLRWVIALLVLVCQLHLCSADYLKPTGEVCNVCPTLQHSNEAQGTLSHGDCHDCCHLQACPTPEQKAVATYVASGFDLAMDLPVLPTEVVFPAVVTPAKPIWFVASHPPTGPPSTKNSRAPPSFRLA